MTFDVQVRQGSNELTLILRGELDMAATDTLHKALLDLKELDDALPTTIVVDLRQLEFLDSSGLHGLIDAHDQVRAAGSKVLLVRGPQYVQRVFELTGVDDSFEFVDGV
ncbi:MAG TPA: STAS domain-containing protein [Actinomycetota bacterium]|nr:STAS domain-containing protein [Actinomycetota bacterium]